MRKHKLDDKKVVCPRAELLCGGTRVLKRGMFFVCAQGDQTHLCRSLGHVTAANSDGDAFDGIMAMVLSLDASNVYIRWILPEEVLRIDAEPPHKLAAFFFQPTLPYSAETITRLIDYGTCSERYIDGAAKRVEEWKAA